MRVSDTEDASTAVREQTTPAMCVLLRSLPYQLDRRECPCLSDSCPTGLLIIHNRCYPRRLLRHPRRRRRSHLSGRWVVMQEGRREEDDDLSAKLLASTAQRKDKRPKLRRSPPPNTTLKQVARLERVRKMEARWPDQVVGEEWGGGAAGGAVGEGLGGGEGEVDFWENPFHVAE